MDLWKLFTVPFVREQRKETDFNTRGFKGITQYKGRFVVYLSFFFTFCEGSLGLSILVSIIRCHGNDCFQSDSVPQC
jgi:hypothetical protein